MKGRGGTYLGDLGTSLTFDHVCFPSFQLVFELEPLGGRADAATDAAAAAAVTLKPRERKDARDKVQTYFTASSAKRLLRYYAEDYIRLGIALPEWLADLPFPAD